MPPEPLAALPDTETLNESENKSQNIQSNRTGNFVDRLGAHAKKVIGVVSLATALSAGIGGTQDVHAEGNGNQARVTQNKLQKESIDESKLTESSKWARRYVLDARADMKKIKTAQDAEWLLNTYLGPMMNEFYYPTKGKVERIEPGLTDRTYGEEDAKLVLQSCEEMVDILRELHLRYGVRAYDRRLEQIDDMIARMKTKSSYAYQKEQELLNKMLREKNW
jgi:hypothetical protein